MLPFTWMSLGCLVTLHCLEAIPIDIPGLPCQCAYLRAGNSQHFPSRGAGGHATNNLRNMYSANIDCIVPPENLHQDYFRWKSVRFPSNTWHYSLLPTAKVISQHHFQLWTTHVYLFVLPVHMLRHFAEIWCQWCWPNNMEINNVSTTALYYGNTYMYRA